LRITHTAHRLTIRGSPGCFWLLGAFFIILSFIFILGPLGLFTNANAISLPERILAFAMGFIGVAAGLYMLASSPYTVATFDRQQGHVDIKRVGLFRRSSERYPLADILSVDIEESRDGDGDPIYQLQMTLRSGQHVPLSRLWMQGKDEHEQVRQTLQNFLSDTHTF
jgi:hypothetical protein